MKLNINKSIFNEVYYPYLLDYSKRFEVYYGSAGSGKSVFITQKLLVKALKSTRRILVARKTARSNEASTFRLFIDTLNQFQLTPYCTINKTTEKITLPNNSEIMFTGLDDREKLKSITGITDIFIEEATEISEDDFNQLNLRLRSRAGDLQIYIAFNPISKVNWTFKKWFSDDASVDATTTQILKTTYKDNKFLPQEYIDTIEGYKDTNPYYYRVYGLGEFASLDKLIFSNYHTEDLDLDTLRAFKLEHLVGLDFGYAADPTAIVQAFLDEEHKKLYVYDEVYEKGLLNNEIADLLKLKGLSKSTIIADSAEPKSIEEIKRAGISRIKSAVKGKDSINQGIQKLQQYELIIDSSCFNLLEELENYSWKKDKASGEYTNQPIDKYNHLIDALRYSLQCVDVKAKLKTLPSNTL